MTVSKLVYGAGELTCTHAFRIASHVGLVPAWIARFAKLCPNSKSCEWLAKHFPKHAQQIIAEPDTFLASLTSYLQQHNPDEYITLGTGENVLCKVKRVNGKKNTDGMFWDLFERGQDVYEFFDDQIRVHHMDGSTSIIMSPSMVKKFPVGTASLMSMRRIATLANTPKTLAKLCEYKLSSELWVDLLNVQFPANYNAEGMLVPHPVLQPLSEPAIQLGAKLIEIAFKKLNDD